MRQTDLWKLLGQELILLLGCEMEIVMETQLSPILSLARMALHGIGNLTLGLLVPPILIFG